MSVSEILTNANSWIVSHKELVTVIAVPLLTWFVSWRVNLSSENKEQLRNQSAQENAEKQRQLERRLSQELKLADFRQAWINDFRSEIADYSSLLWDGDTGSGVDAKREKIRLQASILMRLNPDDKDYQVIRAGLLHPVADPENERKALALIVQPFLKREWDRIKRDLSIDETPQ